MNQIDQAGALRLRVGIEGFKKRALKLTIIATQCFKAPWIKNALMSLVTVEVKHLHF